MSTTIERSSQYKVIGKDVLRPDGVDKVTGRAVFADDVHLNGMLHAKVLRSPHAHAKIRSIDVSEALKMPGVRAVVTSEDFPPIPEGIVKEEGAAFFALASDKVLFRGHAVAAVAADSPHVADEALSKIKVEYEVLKAVLDPREAMEPGAPVLHEKLNPMSFGARLEQHSPNALQQITSMGDIEQGFREADVVVEREFTTKTVHQGYIEPQSCVVDTAPDGSVTIWSTCQGPFRHRDNTADLLQLPQNKVKVIPTEIGGGFGGKEVPYLEPMAAILSRKTGRPVKITMSRSDVFEGTGPACASYMRVKFGAKKTGELVAAHLYFCFEAGAFPGAPVGGAVGIGLGRYKIPNQLVEGFDVVVNKPRTQPYRAPGATQIHFATEGVVDELCEKIGMDPIEFRLKNVVQEGDRNVQGVPFLRIGGVEVLEAIKNSDHYKTPLEGPNRGRGVALGFWRNGGGMSSCSISVHPDGTVSIIEGSPDLSGTRTGIGMQAAETLGIPFEDVRITVVDTDSVGYTMGSWGSRTSFATGWAAIEAARDVNLKMVERASSIWSVPPEEVEVSDGTFYHRDDGSKKFTFKQLAARLNATGGPVVGSSVVDPTRGVGPAFAANVVDLEVDPETGKVTILRYTVAQDVGQALHPGMVEGQLEGGTVQGIGWALNEEYFFDNDGQMRNSSFLDYRMPVALDVPMIDTIIIEVPNPGHPYGVRGVGENNIITPPAAIAAAIHNAIGVRMTDLPMSPGYVLQALWQQNGH